MTDSLPSETKTLAAGKPPKGAQAGSTARSPSRQPWKDLFSQEELLKKQNVSRCTAGQVRLQTERDQHVFMGG
jgi:hypothetical protein